MHLHACLVHVSLVKCFATRSHFLAVTFDFMSFFIITFLGEHTFFSLAVFDTSTVLITREPRIKFVAALEKNILTEKLFQINICI